MFRSRALSLVCVLSLVHSEIMTCSAASGVALAQ